MSGAGGIDTSIYDRLAPQQPLQMMGQIANIRNAQNENLAFQQQYKSRLAMGQIMQQSVDQKTGQPDYSKAATLAAQNPDAAWMAPDLMSKAMTMQGVSLENVLKQYDVANKQIGMYGDAAGSLLQYGDQVTRAQVAERMSAMATAMTEAGIHDPSIYDGIINFMGSLPQDGQPLHQLLQRTAQHYAGAKDSMDRLRDSFQTVDDGQQIHLGAFNPQSGQFHPIGVIGKSMSPDAQGAMVETTDPITGEKKIAPRSMVAPTPGGQLGLTPPAGLPAAAPSNAPPGGTPPPANWTPPTTALPPLRADQLKNAGEYQKKLNDDVGLINQNMQSIQQLQDLTSKVHTGFGAEERLEAGRVLKSLNFPDSFTDRVANGSLAGSQEIMKYSVPNAMNTLRNSLGNQSRITNMEFGSFQRANPNLETDPQAMGKILDFTKRLMGLKQQEQHAYGKYLQAGRDPTQWESTWTNELVNRHVVTPGDMYKPYKGM